jgi:hypothetical protein
MGTTRYQSQNKREGRKRCDGKVKRDGHEEEFVTKALGHILVLTARATGFKDSFNSDHSSKNSSFFRSARFLLLFHSMSGG